MRALLVLILICPCRLLMGQSEHKNLVYKENPDSPDLQALNLVLPSNSSAPLLIWIGGGAWSYVDRNVEMPLARQFAQKGIAVASIGHRLSSATWKDPSLVSENKHPDHIEDVAAAVDWLVKNAGKYGYDPDNIFIGGYSSGAHLAALLCLDPTYLEAHDLDPTIFKGVISVAGAYDIPNYHSVFLNGNRRELARLHVEAVFGDSKEEWLNASPTEYVKNHQVPMLLISESNTYNYTRLMENKMKYKADFTVKHYQEVDHTALWKDLSYADESQYRMDIINFINSYSEEQSLFD